MTWAGSTGWRPRAPRSPRRRATGVAAALDQLDRTFEAVAGRSAARAEGDSGGGRTVAYLDCMRDLDVTLGPAVLDELRASLPPVLYASRWWCGKVFERGAALLGQIADGHAGPLAPLLGPLMGAGFGLWNQLDAEQAELQRRWAAVTSGERRAAEAFADWTPAWHGSGYHSADIQIAAADADAIARGDFLMVLGDFHGGDNPLAQGVFGLRHPDPAALLRRIRAETGPGVHLSPPRRGVVEMTARSWPLYPEGDVVVAAGDEPAPAGTRRVALEDVIVADGRVTDRAGTFSAPLAEFLYLPIFVAGLRSFAPVVPQDGHRAQIGRLVVPPRELVGSSERARRRPGRLGARARAPAPRLRPLAARAQAALRRLREPGAVPGPQALRRPRRGTAGRVHRDAPRTRRVLAAERRRPPHQRASSCGPGSPLTNTGAPAAAHPQRLAPPTLLTAQRAASRARAGGRARRPGGGTTSVGPTIRQRTPSRVRRGAWRRRSRPPRCGR